MTIEHLGCLGLRVRAGVGLVQDDHRSSPAFPRHDQLPIEAGVVDRLIEPRDHGDDVDVGRQHLLCGVTADAVPGQCRPTGQDLRHCERRIRRRSGTEQDPVADSRKRFAGRGRFASRVNDRASVSIDAHDSGRQAIGPIRRRDERGDAVSPSDRFERRGRGQGSGAHRGPDEWRPEIQDQTTQISWKAGTPATIRRGRRRNGWRRQRAQGRRPVQARLAWPPPSPVRGPRVGPLTEER